MKIVIHMFLFLIRQRKGEAKVKELKLALELEKFLVSRREILCYVPYHEFGKLFITTGHISL